MKIAKTGAAFGLAALTLASSLSLGAAAHAAPASAPKAGASSKLAADHILVPFIGKNPDGTFWAATNTGSYGGRTADGSYSEAKKSAVNIQIPKPGTSGVIWTEDASKCYLASSGIMYPYAASSSYCANGGTFSTFAVSTDGALTNTHAPSTHLSSKPNSTYSGAVGFAAPTTAAPEAKLALIQTEVTQVDVFNRTAQITGNGEPGATVVLQNHENFVNKDGEWAAEVTGLKIGDNKFTAKQFDADGVEIEGGDIEFTVTVETTTLSAGLLSTDTASGTAEIGGKATPGGTVLLDGKTEIPVDKDGQWSHTLTNLKLGANSVKLAQYVDDVHVSGDQTLDVPLTIRDLTIDHAFGAAVTDEVELSGKAEGNAGIIITDVDGKETTTKANAAGAWSAPVPAPGAGQQTFTVVQRVHDMDSAPATETVDYGKALAVTSPEDGDKVTEGQDIHFEGTAQRGSKVEITDNGATTAFTSSNPIVTGYWDASARSVSAGEHEYAITQTTKGNLKQVETVTVNKGDSNEVAPVKITNPANPADGYVANTPFTFKGTAQPNSVITVQNNKGLLIGSNVKVSAQGVWEWTYADMKSYTWQLDFISNKGQADEQTGELRNFAPKQVQTYLTNPANSADGYEANKAFTFKGKARPGSVITVQNFKGLVLAANVQVDGQGDWEWTYQNMKTTIWQLDFVADKGTAIEDAAILRNFGPRP